MAYWKYRGWDATETYLEGVADGPDPLVVAVALRQLGVQVYDMATINVAAYRAGCKLDPRAGRLREIIPEILEQKRVWERWRMWYALKRWRGPLLVAGVAIAIASVALYILL